MARPKKKSSLVDGMTELVESLRSIEAKVNELLKSKNNSMPKRGPGRPSGSAKRKPGRPASGRKPGRPVGSAKRGPGRPAAKRGPGRPASAAKNKPGRKPKSRRGRPAGSKNKK